jgi:hypothetical protein
MKLLNLPATSLQYHLFVSQKVDQVLLLVDLLFSQSNFPFQARDGASAFP